MESVNLTSSTSVNTFDGQLFFYYTLSSLGILGNGFVCFVMLRYRKVFNSTTNKLIIHQSCLDLIGSCVFLVERFAHMGVVPDSFLGRLYCHVWWSEWPQYGMFVASTWNLVAISVERYLAICRPVWYRNVFTPRRLKLVMMTAWMMGWVEAAHLLVVCFYDSEVLGCNVSWFSSEIQAVAGVLVFLHELVVPMSIMVLCYSLIIWKLRQRAQAHGRDNNTSAQETFSKANRNVTQTVVLVTIFFFICWSPTETNYLLFNLSVYQPVNLYEDIFYRVTGGIVVINLCINPLIYCFTYERFQKQLKEMVGRRTRRVEDTSNST
ncbi:mu-type opioid receptor-like [Asterias rubens]|uniref:mu-type opioid receptor-like n=1 Tax=Asterias rubens TaxID=7604 RepID=UPI001455A23C|nr:mu-type opioid receptor-like [Asterias rubens]